MREGLHWKIPIVFMRNLIFVSSDYLLPFFTQNMCLSFLSYRISCTFYSDENVGLSTLTQFSLLVIMQKTSKSQKGNVQIPHRTWGYYYKQMHCQEPIVFHPQNQQRVPGVHALHQGFPWRLYFLSFLHLHCCKSLETGIKNRSSHYLTFGITLESL